MHVCVLNLENIKDIRVCEGYKDTKGTLLFIINAENENLPFWSLEFHPPKQTNVDGN